MDERSTQLAKELDRLKDELNGCRAAKQESQEKKRQLRAEYKAFRQREREAESSGNDRLAEELESKVDSIGADIDALDDEIDALDSKIDELEDRIEDITEELERMDEERSWSQPRGVHININGKDLGDEINKGINKAMSKLREIDFEEIGNDISKTVEQAANEASECVKNATHSTENGNHSFTAMGTLGGGTYGKISFSGGGRIIGDISCESLTVSGGVKASGNISSAGEIRTSGSLSCTGNIEAESIRTSGSAKVEGNLNSGSIRTSGTLSVSGSVKGEEIRTSGSIKAGGDCEAESFFSSGLLRISGLLNSGTIEIRLDSLGSDSSVFSIGCENISVYMAKGTPFSMFKGRLVTGSIEGDLIRLENTSAKIVRGRDVYIGDGCEIDLIEYSGKCEILGDSMIKEKRQV